MNYFVLIIMFFLYLPLSFSQTMPKARYLNVENDKNILVHTGTEFCANCSEKNYVLDGNESLGYVELYFSSVSNHGKPTKAQLIMNVADVEYAESGNGFAVFYQDEKIGSIQQVARNSCLVIELKHTEIANSNRIKLILKANGDDGLYLLSKKSGFGAVLKLQY